MLQSWSNLQCCNAAAIRVPGGGCSTNCFGALVVSAEGVFQTFSSNSLALVAVGLTLQVYSRLRQVHDCQAAGNGVWRNRSALGKFVPKSTAL
jgi:hypothetical protein